MTIGPIVDRMSFPIFLDHHSTTPVDPRVFEAMRPWFTELYGNPHSADHAYGWRAEAAVEAARRGIAELIGARPAEIVFTSGATESNNLALKGAAANLAPDRRHVITTTFEHPCVTGVFAELETQGYRVTRIAPTAAGSIEASAIAAALTEETGLVSVTTAQHEIGTLQPIGEIAALLRPRGIVFHTDAAQAVGKIAVSVAADGAGAGIDLLSLSAHKLYGPMGIGALFIRRRPGLTVTPLFAGGGQQRGIRPGTIPTPLAVGLGAACRVAGEQMHTDGVRLSRLRDRLLDGLQREIPGLAVNGGLDRRLPHNLNIRLPGVAAVDLIHAMRDRIAVSAGSACASAVIEPSPSLLAIGLQEAQALASIRIGLGRQTTDAEIVTASDVIAATWRQLRSEA